MVINFRAVRLPKVKTLAEDWFEPQLEECRIAFPRAVQRKLGDAARRGMAHSPPTYGEVEILAEKEVERCGQIFLAGYKQAFEAVSNPIRSATLAQVKRDLDTLLTSESDRVLKTIQYVREACQPVPAKDAVQLRDRTQRKLVAELDLLVTRLNTDRGIRKNLIAALLAFLLFIFSYLPQWAASVWSLFSSRPLIPYFIEKIPTLGRILAAFDWGVVSIALRIIGASLLLWLLIRMLRRYYSRR